MIAELEYQSFDTFRSTVQALVAPEGLGEELIPFFRDQVGNALADLETTLKWTRNYNVAFYEKQDVQEFCGASILAGPLGKVSQVFAYRPGLDCRKLYYRHVSTSALDCWMDETRCALCNFTDSTAIYDSPYCNYVISGTYGCDVPYLTPPEDDCRFKSLSDDERMFAVGPDNKIFLAPRFPCGYVIVVQWNGVHRKFNNNDMVLVDQQVREFVVNYVEHKVALKEKDRVAAKDYWDVSAINLRMLNHRHWDETNVEAKRDCSAALEQMMSSFQPLYQTSVFGPFGVPFPSPTGQGTDIVQLYAGTAPPTAPNDPTLPAKFYYFEGFGEGELNWDVPKQKWF